MLEHLKDMASRAGYELKKTAESVATARFWHDSFESLGWNQPGPAPWGQDVINSQVASMVDQQLRTSSSLATQEVSDFRQPRPPKREELQVQRTPVEYKRPPG